jgi:hypothetical protein
MINGHDDILLQHLKDLTYDTWITACSGFIAGAKQHIKIVKGNVEDREYHLNRAEVALRRATLCREWAIACWLETECGYKHLKELFFDKTEVFFD